MKFKKGDVIRPIEDQYGAWVVEKIEPCADYPAGYVYAQSAYSDGTTMGDASRYRLVPDGANEALSVLRRQMERSEKVAALLPGGCALYREVQTVNLRWGGIGMSVEVALEAGNRLLQDYDLKEALAMVAATMPPQSEDPALKWTDVDDAAKKRTIEIVLGPVRRVAIPAVPARA